MKPKWKQLINAVKIAVQYWQPILVFEQLIQEIKDNGNKKTTE